MYSDVMDFATGATRDVWGTQLVAQTITWSKLKKLMLEDGAVSRFAYCEKAKALVQHPVADIQVGGHPRTDHSAQGKLNNEEGRTAVYFLCWVAVRLLCLEPIIVSEHVPGLLCGHFTSCSNRLATS